MCRQYLIKPCFQKGMFLDSLCYVPLNHFSLMTVWWVGDLQKVPSLAALHKSLPSKKTKTKTNLYNISCSCFFFPCLFLWSSFGLRKGSHQSGSSCPVLLHYKSFESKQYSKRQRMMRHAGQQHLEGCMLFNPGVVVPSLGFPDVSGLPTPRNLGQHS